MGQLTWIILLLLLFQYLDDSLIFIGIVDTSFIKASFTIQYVYDIPFFFSKDTHTVLRLFFSQD